MISVAEMHRKTNLLYLNDSRYLNQCAIAHKHNIDSFMFDNSKCPSLRSSNRIKLFVPRALNRCFESSFVLRSIKKWNSLSEHFKMIPPCETKLFKTRVKKEMIGNKLNFPE